MPTALPFTFTFAGTPYTSLNVCSNGFMSFSNIGGSEYSPVSDVGTANVIAPFGNLLIPASGIMGDLTAGSNTITNCTSVVGYSVGDLLADLNFDFGADPVITAIVGNNIVVNIPSQNTVPGSDVVAYAFIVKAVSGTAPNRIFEIEYRHVSRINFFFDPMYNEVLNFKVKLYETSNRIEFLYYLIPGSDSSPGSEIGLKGASNADFNSRTVTEGTNTWATSAAATNITDVCELANTLFPVSGQMYAWAPFTCNTPTLSVSQSPSVSCAGAMAVLTASGATSYTWTSGPTTAQYSVNPNTTSTYTLTGADNGCTATLVVTHSVNPIPVVSVSQASATICQGASAVLTASGATTYSWSNGNQTTAQVTVTPAGTTVYTVTGTSLGCSATATITQNVSVCNGIQDNSLAQDVAVYPNPFRNELNLHNGSDAEVQVTVTDALGKVVLNATIPGGTQSLNTSELNNGLYIVRISNGDKSISRKLVKANP